MSNDPGLTWGQIAGLMAIITFMIAVGGVVVRQVIWTSRNEASAKAARAIADEAKMDALRAATLANEAMKAANLATTGALRDLGDFREKVAREYATHEAMRQLEVGLVAAINRLGDRLDRLFETQHVPNSGK